MTKIVAPSLGAGWSSPESARRAASKNLGMRRYLTLREVLTRIRNAQTLPRVAIPARAALVSQTASELRSTARKLESDPAFAGIALRLRRIADHELRKYAALAAQTEERVLSVNRVEPGALPRRTDRIKTQLVRMALAEAKQGESELGPGKLRTGAFKPTGLAYFGIAENLDKPALDVSDFKGRLVTNWANVLRDATRTD